MVDGRSGVEHTWKDPGDQPEVPRRWAAQQARPGIRMRGVFEGVLVILSALGTEAVIADNPPVVERMLDHSCREVRRA